jgi:uncharacterized protein YacL
MILNIIRVIFFLLVLAVAEIYLSHLIESSFWSYAIMYGGVVLATAVILFDFLFKKKNLAAISGLFLGVLVGMVVAWGLGYLVQQAAVTFLLPATLAAQAPLLEGIKLLLVLVCVYAAVSVILQTRDDFRFIIPYVEFNRAKRGPRPFILDTSVIIDGRIADVAATGIFESRVMVPQFVIQELQNVADSKDKLKRSYGRRGLDVLRRMQKMPRVDLYVWDGTLPESAAVQGVDLKLVALARQENGRLVTDDYNLNKVAALHEVEVINLNDLTNALKPLAAPGEQLHVRIIKRGETPNQGVGYLEDGTMVVVEEARPHIGQEVDVFVTNVVQTSAGRMIFSQLEPPPGVRVAHGTRPVEL